MKAKCKKTYPYDSEDILKTSSQIFIKNENYEYKILNTDSCENWYLVQPHDEYSKSELFNESEFEIYFISSNDIRKIKLENIANEQDIQRIVYGK